VTAPASIDALQQSPPVAALPAPAPNAEHDRAAWLRWRQKGLGGSDAAAIVGLDPFRSAMMVWLEKTGMLPVDHAAEDEPMRWGRRFESVIVEEFEQRTDLRVGAQQLGAVHPERPHLRATLDGFVYEGQAEEAAPLGIYEAKTASRRAWDWLAGVPDHVQVQVQHNLAVTGLGHAWVATLLLSPVPRLVIRELERDDAAIDVLVQLEDAFWQRVLEQRPPAADSGEATAEALRRAFSDPVAGQSVELTAEGLELVRQRSRAKAEETAAAARRQGAENALMAMLGGAEIGLVNGREVLTWKRFEQQRLDVDALRQRHPKIAARFTKPVASRRLVFKQLATTEEPGNDE